MWSLRLKNKTCFRKACNQLVKDYGWFEKLEDNEIVEIPSTIKKEIIEGFQKFYPRCNVKRKLVDEAIDVKYVMSATGLNGCFVLVGPDNIQAPVSTKCLKRNINWDMSEACRGAIHYCQIMQFRFENGKDTDEVDHCNDGGFAAIKNAWIKLHGKNNLIKYIVKNNASDKQTSKVGFYTWKEPMLSDWKKYHKAHASLQCLSKEEHMSLTRTRIKTADSASS